jgi:hypothetical protein
MSQTVENELTDAAPEAEKEAVNKSSSPQIREGEKAIIVAHHSVECCAMNGQGQFNRSQPVRRFRVGKPEPYAQYKQSVSISFQEPRKRNWQGYRVYTNNLTYYTIHNETGIIYDSRQDVPVDMEEFEATKRRDVQQWRDNGCTVVGVDEVKS